jgi:hypothetical protein
MINKRKELIQEYEKSKNDCDTKRSQLLNYLLLEVRTLIEQEKSLEVIGIIKEIPDGDMQNLLYNEINNK